jgi:hypothetical protein
MDTVDSSLAPENERRLALCLAPFSKEFYIATGYSRLQVSDEYAELIRVIIWQNPQCQKKGLPVLSPSEFELFLQEEMSQDFSDLGIEIDDFFADLITNHLEEEKSFAIYNKFIESQTSKSVQIDPTSDLDRKPSPQKTIQTKRNYHTMQSYNSTADNKVSSVDASPTLPPENLLKKFVNVTDEPSNPSSHIDKPIILKNKEARRHVHRYDLRIGIKECRNDEEEQKILQNLLEDFFETMLSADKTIVIPPYYELDCSNTTFQDLSKSYRIAELDSFTKLKQYFSPLGNRNPNTGFVYCSCIVAASTPHSALMTQVSNILQESKLSLWPRSCDHENVG